MSLKPVVPTETWIALVREGLERFDRDAELYIRPMYWAEDAAGGAVRPDPETTRWCLTMYVAPLPKPTGTAITLSPFRRPTRDSAPVEAKAGCLYPQNARAMIEARARGFDNCLMCDALGNVAELGSANIFMAKDGVIFTPVANGTFLAGITRRRVIALLQDVGTTVVETTLRYCDFQSADEIFCTGQLQQGDPGHAHRRSPAPAGAVLPQGARALLGLCARGRSLIAARLHYCNGQLCDRAAADIINARIDDAVAHDLQQYGCVELGAIEFPKRQREVGLVPELSSLNAGPSATQTGDCGPHTATFHGPSGGASWRCAKSRDQPSRRLRQRKAPIVQHEQRPRALCAADEMIEVRVLVGVQPDHIDDR